MHRSLNWLVSLLVTLCLQTHVALITQVNADEFNYDESLVPDYELPNPLLAENDALIDSAEKWNGTVDSKGHREFVFKQVETHVYGRLLDNDVEQSVVESKTQIVGSMKQKQVKIRLSRMGKTLDLEMLMHLPADATKPVPTFIALNFNGNHTTTADVSVSVTKNWVRNNEKIGYQDNRATEEARASSASRWSYEQIVARGYGVATIYYGDIDPDFHDGFKNGVHALFPDEERTPASGGSLAAWAWGLSRAMDYLETDSDVDKSRVIVMGHSRLGKAALWAGANDQRFAMVVSNNSGCGGAALSRRRFGETVKRINTSFPHWFCENHRRYNDDEDACPIDQHWVIALIAPRPVLICSAEDDRWADPKGEFLSGKAADGVYRLLGTDGMSADVWPDVNTPVMSRIGYHRRPGKHDVKLQDWNVYMDFADKHLGKGG